jgi:hypothetical protein
MAARDRLPLDAFVVVEDDLDAVAREFVAGFLVDELREAWVDVGAVLRVPTARPTG